MREHNQLFTKTISYLSEAGSSTFFLFLFLLLKNFRDQLILKKHSVVICAHEEYSPDKQSKICKRKKKVIKPCFFLLTLKSIFI